MVESIECFVREVLSLQTGYRLRMSIVFLYHQPLFSETHVCEACHEKVIANGECYLYIYIETQNYVCMHICNPLLWVGLHICMHTCVHTHIHSLTHSHIMYTQKMRFLSSLIECLILIKFEYFFLV